MKQTIKLLSLVLGISIIFAGCDVTPNIGTANQVGGDTSGAQTWVEFPRDGQVLPKKDTAFVVYSTAADGVSSITLKLNGEPLPVVPVSGISTDGSGRMARLDQNWTPPHEGEYTLEAASGSGSSAIKFCVVTCGTSVEQDAVEVHSSTETTPTPTADISDTPVPATATMTSTSSPTVKPSVTATWVPTYTPTFEPTYTSPPPADTTGPSVNSVSTFWEGCSLYGTASISDPSGVIWAEFWFNHNGEGWAWITDKSKWWTMGQPGRCRYKRFRRLNGI